MRVVLDTNVLVAGMLKPFGPCGEIVRMLAAGLLRVCVDARVLAEYSEVLGRPRFGIGPEALAAALEYIAISAETFGGGPLLLSLPDPDDEPFLEVAVQSKSDFLVTGNLRHFPARAAQGVRVVSPAEFLDLYKKMEHPKGQ